MCIDCFFFGTHKIKGTKEAYKKDEFVVKIETFDLISKRIFEICDIEGIMVGYRRVLQLLKLFKKDKGSAISYSSAGIYNFFVGQEVGGRM